jgi:hypothetical protein
VVHASITASSEAKLAGGGGGDKGKGKGKLRAETEAGVERAKTNHRIVAPIEEEGSRAEVAALSDRVGDGVWVF